MTGTVVVVSLTYADGRNRPGSGSGKSDGYCSLVAKYKLSLDQPAGKGRDTAAQLAEVRRNIDEVAKKAPSEIRADVEVFAAAYARATDAVAGSGGAVDSGALQALSSPELEAGLARIAAYDKRVCGIG